MRFCLAEGDLVDELFVRNVCYGFRQQLLRILSRLYRTTPPSTGSVSLAEANLTLLPVSLLTTDYQLLTTNY